MSRLPDALGAAVAEIRCKHELRVIDCADCRPQPVTPGRPPARFRSFEDADEPGAEFADRPSRVFPAAFEGRCPGCNGRIDIGDPIRVIAGRGHHDGCEPGY